METTVIKAHGIQDMNAKAQQWVDDNIPDNWDRSISRTSLKISSAC